MVSVPWNGGKPKTLVKNATLPSFSFYVDEVGLERPTWRRIETLSE